MAAEGPSSSSADTSNKQEVMKKAAELMAQGKRNMVCGEVPKAVSLYEDAVKVLVKECGELSRDCADAYFKCGSALLELGRMETNVLGQALEGVDVEEEKEEEEESEQFEKPPAEGEERQKLREEVYEAMAEGAREEDLKKSAVDEPKEISTEPSAGELKNGTTETSEMETDAKSTENGEEKKHIHLNGTGKEKEPSTDKAEPATNEAESASEGSRKTEPAVEGSGKADPASEGSGKADPESAEGEAEDADQDGEETAEGEESQEGEEEEENEGEEKEEDVPNFQLAWEYLDLAKVIFLRSDSKEDQLKAAECHIKLGEVSMETEQHATAAEDLQSALTIQQKHLPPEDRLIAETHYQLGLAYGLGKEFELSIQHYQQAISVIEAKIASLNKLVEENEVDAENKENRETDELKKYKDEIKELQELIPEMKNKIEDTQVEAKDMEQMKQMAKEVLGLTGTSKGFGSPTKKPESGASSSSASADVDENGEKKATDIAHLIRKKRKPEDDGPAPTAQEIKKLRQDESAAGDASTKIDAEIKVNGTSEVTVNGMDNASDEPAVNGINGISEDKKIDESGAAEPMAT